MKFTSCPKCGSAASRRGPTEFQHWVRLIIDSSKRFCPGCGHKWRMRRMVAPMTGYQVGFLFVTILVAIGTAHILTSYQQKRALTHRKDIISQAANLDRLRKDITRDPTSLQRMNANDRELLKQAAKKYGAL